MSICNRAYPCMCGAIHNFTPYVCPPPQNNEVLNKMEWMAERIAHIEHKLDQILGTIIK